MIFDSMNRFASYAKLSPEVWKKLATFIAGCTPETPAASRLSSSRRLFFRR